MVCHSARSFIVDFDCGCSQAKFWTGKVTSTTASLVIPTMAEVDSAWQSALSALAAGSTGESSASRSSPLGAWLDSTHAKSLLRSSVVEDDATAPQWVSRVIGLQAQITALSSSRVSADEVVTEAIKEKIYHLVTAALSQLRAPDDLSKIIGRLADESRTLEARLSSLSSGSR